MKQGFTLFLLLFSALTASTAVLAEEPSTATTAPYLLAGAPTFDLSISQFRENFNTQNPKLILNEFRAIDSSRDRANLTRAASKINENLYASSALERGTLKIKSMQITWLPIQGPEQKAAKAKALEYMSAILQAFTPAAFPPTTLIRLYEFLKNNSLFRDRPEHCVQRSGLS